LPRATALGSSDRRRDALSGRRLDILAPEGMMEIGNIWFNPALQQEWG
jgi:hypothetical protein